VCIQVKFTDYTDIKALDAFASIVG